MALALSTWGADSVSVVFHEIHYRSPAGDSQDEFIELRNLGQAPVDLQGWTVSGGIEFQFLNPAVLEADGLLVVAANPDRIRAVHGSGIRMEGPWKGRLGNSGETLVLRSANGNEVDRVAYAEDGDWSYRMRGPIDGGHRGLVWNGAHDGGGASLELVQPGLPNDLGANWAASRVPGGTPGLTNSVAALNVAPLIAGARQSPWVPRSAEPVAVFAQIFDEAPGVRATVHFRLDGTEVFLSVPMRDDGSDVDRDAGDGWFAASLPNQPSGSVVEWYIESYDAGGLRRTWPAPIHEDEGERQNANALYVVDDAVDGGGDALFRVVLREVDRAELLQINRNRPVAPFPTLNQTTSHAAFNGTFIVTANGRTEGRYNVGIRNRGNGSRAALPQSLRVNVPADRRWEGVRAINLNSQVPDLQCLGSLLMRRAGLPAAQSRPIQVRFNTENPTVPTYPNLGFYVANEVIDGDFAGRQFPQDDRGAIYRGQRQDFPVQQHANLDYLGEDPQPYRAVYFKRTGIAEDDWKDLIELTRVLSLTPEPSFADEVRRVVDAEQWALYFAANSLLNNQETSPVNGQGDDYFMIRGEQDRRFRLLPYDLDTLVGGGFPAGNPSDPLLLMVGRRTPAFERFIIHPEFAPLFFREVRRLAMTVWSPEEFARLSERVLGGRIPRERLAAMQRFHADRVAYALQAMPTNIVVNASQPGPDGQVTLSGLADPTRTRQVWVNEVSADWKPWTTRWTLGAFPLLPGHNHLTVQALDGSGNEVARTTLDLTWAPSVRTRVSGVLAGDTVWTVAGGPYELEGTVVVPAQAKLRIEPGVTVYAAPGSGLELAGTLEALGDPHRRIRFMASPESLNPTNSWNGLRWPGSGDDVIHRMVCVDVDHAGLGGHTLEAIDATVILDRCTFSGTTRTLLETRRSSFEILACEFPSVIGSEIIHGMQIRPGGRFLLDGNRFGGTTAGNDVVDFTGARRPGPVLEVRNNVFTGSMDDVLDLDGCDAHVEGNLFLNVSNGDPSHPNTSSAISFGGAEGYAPHVVVARNVFVDVDHVVLCKEGGFVTLEHNTAVRVGISVVNFSEPARGVAPGAGARLEGNIVVDCPRILENEVPTNGTVVVTALRNVVPEGQPGELGDENWALDPLLVRPGILGSDPKAIRSALALRSGSPVVGWGRAGLNPGADVAAGIAVSGIRRPRDWHTNLAVEVYGPGLVAYRWRLDGGPWSPSIPSVSATVALGGLHPGDHQLELVGLDSAGRWQSESEPLQIVWTTDPGAAGVRLSEVLVAPSPGAMGYVELWNDSAADIDLGGWWLMVGSGNLSPGPFAQGTILAAGERRAFPRDSQPRGGSVVLWNRDGESVDEVRFGDQVSGLSLGRWEDGWALSTPTPGMPNRRVATGNPDALKINEWLARGRYLAADDFVELFNPEPWPVSLNALALTDNPVGFPGRSPWPTLSFMGARQVVAWVADGRNEPGHVAFRLSNEGGDLALLREDGRVLDSFQYLPQLDDLAEGRSPDGAEMIRVFSHPTPGRPNPDLSRPPGEGGGLRLSELKVIGAAGPSPEAWVEIFNDSETEAELGGLELTGEPDGNGTLRFPLGTRIAGHGFQVYLLTSLGLRPAGGRVYFWDRPETGGRLLDGIHYGPQVPGYSVGRVTGFGDEWVLTRPTPGAPNEPAAVIRTERIRINEWMATGAGNDWVELYNPEPLPAVLTGMTLSDDAEDSSKYRFPNLSFVGTGETAFLVMEATEPLWAPGRLGFALRREGEMLTLRSSGGTVVDFVRFGPQTEGVSEGRWPDGASRREFLVPRGTPWAPNVKPSDDDTDGDGLLDAWELAQGLSPRSAAGNDGSHGDPDGDGLSNAEEFEAGTRPTDPSSQVALEIRASGGTWKLHFRQEAGRRYTLEISPNLARGSWDTLATWEPTDNAVDQSRAVGAATDSSLFFRMRVEQP